MMHKAWSSIEQVSNCFSRSSVKFQDHTGKKTPMWTWIGHFQTVTPFELTNDYEMMLKAWSSIEEVPNCFLRSSVKFQGHTGKKITNFHLNWAFALLFYWVIHLISRSYRLKNQWLESNLSKITRPVAAIKSLRFALFFNILLVFPLHLSWITSFNILLNFSLKVLTVGDLLALILKMSGTVSIFHEM